MSNFLIDEETDLLAGEFVLGTLDSAERANAHELLRSDHTFIAMVRIWERRFGELHLMVEPVEPDPAILRRIKAKVVTLAAAAAPEAKAAVAPMAAPPAAPADTPAAPSMPKAANIELKPLQAASDIAAATPGAIANVDEGKKVAETAPPPVEAAGPVAAPSASVAPEVAAAVTGPAAGDPPVTTPSEAASPASDQSTALQPELPAMFPPALASPAPDTTGPAENKLEPTAKGDSQQPSLLPDVPRLPERLSEPIQAPSVGRRRPEITIDVIRSRGRWRAFAVLMSILLLGLAGLLATWRFAPGRLPTELQPAQFMAAIGVAPPPAPKAEAPPVRPTPPAGQFDE
ncbi:MAG TPA: hypothetical protein VKW08_19670 [Xanthobacteraceae bacterium]|jgi:hypothetical protein|nr:hypothetical protein [Xanthobacteraceae bacterium]